MPTPVTPQQAAPVSATHVRWGVGSLVVLVIGSLLVLGGLGAASGGAAILSGDARLRQDGYLPLTTSEAVYSPGHAVVVGDAGLDAGGVDGWWVARLLGDVRVEVSPLGDDALFVGVGAADDVDTYLSGVARTTPGLGDGRHDDVDGGAPEGPPDEQDVWAVSASGTGPQQLDWTPGPGSWSLVLMNADASPVVAADVAVLAKVPWVAEVGVAVVLTGLAVLLLGAVLVLLAVRAAGRPRPGT